MGRPRRFEEPGGFYHVGTRGNDKQAIYVDSFDRRVFLALVRRSVERYGWRCHAWCLMTNHYHLVVELADCGLACGMRDLNGAFARFSNRRHRRIDHVFGKRYFAEHIDSESYLLAASRYVVLNPVRAGIADHPREWRWSSYHASAGLVTPPRFFALHRFLRLFDERPRYAMDAYRNFVEAGVADARAEAAERRRAVPGTGTDV